MADRFVVVASDEVDGEPMAWYVSGNRDRYQASRDPCLMAGVSKRVLKEVEVECIRPDSIPALRAVVGLDGVCPGPMFFQDMLSDVFALGLKVGMEIQRELDRKAVSNLNSDVANGNR